MTLWPRAAPISFPTSLSQMEDGVFYHYRDPSSKYPLVRACVCARPAERKKPWN